MTKQRELILRIVKNCNFHPTAEQVYGIAKKKMPSIVLATVYNNLNALNKLGLIRKIKVHQSPDRYDGTLTIHDHLVCDKCGELTDVSLGNLLQKFRDASGIDLTGYELNLHYICKECRKNIKE